jgi:hypothetical protein
MAKNKKRKIATESVAFEKLHTTAVTCKECHGPTMRYLTGSSNPRVHIHHVITCSIGERLREMGVHPSISHNEVSNATPR